MFSTLSGIPDGIEFAIHFSSKFLITIESYDNEDVITQYEEAVEEGKDASNVTIDDFELIKLIGKGGYS